MEIKINEAEEVLQELTDLKKETPIWYERGKNIVILKRAFKTLTDLYNEERQIIIDQWASKNEKDEPVMITEENEITGKDQKVYDFGDNKAMVTKILTDLHKHTFIKDENGKPCTIDIEFYKVKPENAAKLKEMDLSGLAFSIEFLAL